MAQLRSAPTEKPSSTMASAEVIDMAKLMARRQRRLPRVMAGPDADPQGRWPLHPELLQRIDEQTKPHVRK